MKTIIEVLIALINIMYMHQLMPFDYGKELIHDLEKELKKLPKEANNETDKSNS